MFIPNNNSYRAIITIILFLCVIVPTILTVEFDYFFNGYLYLIVGLSVTSIFYIQLLKLKSVSKLANIVLITRLFILSLCLSYIYSFGNVLIFSDFVPRYQPAEQPILLFTALFYFSLFIHFDIVRKNSYVIGTALIFVLTLLAKIFPPILMSFLEVASKDNHEERMKGYTPADTNGGNDQNDLMSYEDMNPNSRK